MRKSDTITTRNSKIPGQPRASPSIQLRYTNISVQIEFLEVAVLQKGPLLKGFTLPAPVVAGEVVGEFEIDTLLFPLS